MDLLDLAKIVLRRWYVALGVLLLGLVTALVLTSGIQPKYLVEAQSILITGQGALTTEDDVPANPYMSFSGTLFTTLSAVTRTVDGQEQRALLDADGTDRDFVFTTSQEAPVIITETSALTPEESLELSADVQAALADTLVALQAAEDVPEGDQIGIRLLTTSNPVREMGDRNRTLLGVLGVSVAAAIGAAVLAESLLQGRRRTDADDALDEPGDVKSPDADAENPEGTVDEDQGSSDATERDAAPVNRPSQRPAAQRPTSPRPTSPPPPSRSPGRAGSAGRAGPVTPAKPPASTPPSSSPGQKF